MILTVSKRVSQSSPSSLPLPVRHHVHHQRWKEAPTVNPLLLHPPTPAPVPLLTPTSTTPATAPATAPPPASCPSSHCSKISVRIEKTEAPSAAAAEDEEQVGPFSGPSRS